MAYRMRECQQCGKHKYFRDGALVCTRCHSDESRPTSTGPKIHIGVSLPRARRSP